MSWVHARKSLVLLSVALSGGIFAQDVIPDAGANGTVRLLPGDSAVLDLQEPRTDLPCVVVPILPELGFDLRFHAGYAVSVPIAEFEDRINKLMIVFRVFPKALPQQASYFIQRLRIPEVSGRTGGRVRFEGAFRVGEGEYQVDWLMRDQEERFCAGSWDLPAKMSARDRIPPGSVVKNLIEGEDPTLFAEEPPVPRERGDAALRVKVLVNFASQNMESVSLGSFDLEGLVGVLRNISRDPRIARISTVAMSIQSQQVVYRGTGQGVDLPSIGKAIRALHLGTVDLQQLEAKNRETTFLEQVLTEEIGEDSLDAVIFVGPKYYLDSNVSAAIVSRLSTIDAPVFYLNYVTHPVSQPWRDAIGKVVRQLHGIEYSISRPQDLCGAWQDLVSRVVAKRPGARTAARR